MPWEKKRKNILRHKLFGDKIIQKCAAKLCWKFNLTNITRKAKFIFGYTHFKPQGQ